MLIRSSLVPPGAASAPSLALTVCAIGPVWVCSPPPASLDACDSLPCLYCQLKILMPRILSKIPLGLAGWTSSLALASDVAMDGSTPPCACCFSLPKKPLNTAPALSSCFLTLPTLEAGSSFCTGIISSLALTSDVTTGVGSVFTPKAESVLSLSLPRILLDLTGFIFSLMFTSELGCLATCNHWSYNCMLTL